MRVNGLRQTSLAAVMLAGLGFGSGLAAAREGWVKADALPADLGFLAAQCDEREFCFAIACPDATLQLVNLSPGGGPFGNPDMGEAGAAATLRVGGATYALTFDWDDEVLPLAGLAGSRSALPVEALQSLANADGTISGTTTGPVTATIRSAGLKTLWPVLVEACGLPELPGR